MSKVYLIPTVLSDGITECLPAYITDAVKKCDIFFVENERTARRYLKLLWKEMVIDNYQWFTIKDPNNDIRMAFQKALQQNKTIGIISEAGCPGVADPGQQLVAIAQENDATVVPLVGPNSILLALMASGMNGQEFHFHGYLAIDNIDRVNMLKKLEADSKHQNKTQIFIETPYRNNAVLTAITKNLQPQTKLCIAVDLTSPDEFVKTKSVQQWKNSLPDIHKRPAIFLIYAGQ